MRKFKLEINSRVDIVRNDINFKSVIQDIGEDCFYISIPINNGEYLTFNTDEDIEILYYRDETYLYKLTCNIIGTKKDNNIPMYKVSLPKNVIKIQRRNYVRVNVTTSIKYIKGTVLVNMEEELLNGLLLDLSGGGMKLKLKESLDYDDVITVQIICNDIKMYVKGKIVRKNKGVDGRFIYGVVFLDVENNIRERIIQEVFSIMRKQRELI